MERTGDYSATPVLLKYRYADPVFFAPPWPEIYGSDDERQHSFEEAIAEYVHLSRRLDEVGYRVVPLPRSGIEERADIVRRGIADRTLPN